MRRWTRMMAGLVLAAFLGGCAGLPGTTAAPTPTAQAEGGAVALFAVSVGKGDALILQAGDWAGLIDAGKAAARGRVTSALERLGIDRLDGVFLTHTDDDHADGLEWLSAGDIAVDAWYASAMYTGVKEKKHPAMLAAAARGQEVVWLRRGDVLPLGNSGAQLRVLAPASRFDDEDDNSLVMMLESDQGRMLLTGDMELPEEAELLAQGDDLRCAVLKVANHGDGDTTSDALVRAASAQVALISTDSQEKPGTPDASVVARLKAAGSDVVVTQDAGLGIAVTLQDGVATAWSVDIDAAPVSGPCIAQVDPQDDRVVLGNTAGQDVALAGFYLCSSRGKEMFAFPDGAILPAGGTLTVGTRTTEGDFDLLWDDKKVVNKKKNDTFILYDSWGRAVDVKDNGIA